MTRLLRRGSEGEDVFDLQRDLNALFPHSYPHSGAYSLVLDGKFGKNTQAWVMAFQSFAQIKRDGIVGPNTRGAIANYAASMMGERTPTVLPRPVKPKPKASKIVYIHDEHIYDAGETFGRHANRDRDGDVIHLLIPKKDSMAEIVTKVDKALGSNPLELLILNGHGNSRQTNIGEIFDKSNFHHFGKLKTHFGRSGLKLGIEIHSCCFASADAVGPRDYGTIGEGAILVWDSFESAANTFTFGWLGDKKKWHDEDHENRWTPIRKEVGKGTDAMVSIAKSTGSTVKAAFNYQRGDKEGRFEDLWACAWPSGTVKFYSPKIPPASIR